MEHRCIVLGLTVLLVSACVKVPESQVDLGTETDAAVTDANGQADTGSASADGGRPDVAVDSGEIPGDSGVPIVDASNVGVDAGDGGWWDPDWPRRVAFTLAPGAGVVLEDFVVWLPAKTNDPPFDAGEIPANQVRIVAEDGTLLAHDSEAWGTGSGGVWTKVPRVADGTKVWLYFGNQQAVVSEAPQAVWSDYSTVLHFRNQVIQDDATGNGGWGCTGSCGHGSSQMGRSYRPSLDGVIRLGTGSHPGVHVQDNEQLTASIWYVGSSNDFGPVFFAESSCVGWQLSLTSAEEVYFMVAPTNADGSMPCSNTTGRFGTGSREVNLNGGWHNYTLVIDRVSDLMSLYHDGVLAEAIPIASDRPTNDQITVTIGAGLGDQPNFFAGRLDEVQISKTARSAEEIAAHYANVQRDGFVSVGAFEDRE